MMASRLINQELMFVQCKRVVQAIERLIILDPALYISNQKAKAQDCPTILLESSFEIQSCKNKVEFNSALENYFKCFDVRQRLYKMILN